MNQPSRISRRQLTAGCCGAAFLLLAPAVSVREAMAGTPAWPGGNDYRRSIRSYALPDVVLIDSEARPVRLRELLATDETLMLNFIFTTCSTVCPVTVRVFSDVPARLGAASKDVRLISISIDPENDTPARLKTYAKSFGEGLRWQFLTGRVQDIKSVQLAFDTYRGDKMTHEPVTLIRRGRGASWLRIDGFANPDELVSEYRRMAAQ